jgi:cytochrome c peroxidase
MRKFRLIFVFSLISVLFFAACKKEDPLPEITDPVYNPTPYTFNVPWYFPTKMNLNTDNPMTLEGIELGRMLFYDTRLNGKQVADSQMTCASCHLQEYAFECGVNGGKNGDGHPVGITGIPTPHMMLPLFNLVWQQNGYLWNGGIYPGNPVTSKRRLEDLCWMGIHAPHEMFSDTNKSKAAIQNIPGYKPYFQKAFGTDQITFELIAKAITQFTRSIVSCNSKFDMYLQGHAALTPSESSGFVLFVTESGGDCFHCHGGDGNPLFTTYLYYNNAKDNVFTDIRDRYAVTGDPMDIGAYKAPSLRNCELTGPYMHDGRYKTLEEVINFYSDSLVASSYVSPLMHKVAQGGAHLTPQQKADLKAFLLTLTDQTLLTNPAYSMPANLP